MKDLRSCLLGHWIHSHEEDAQGVSVYRPVSYNFPPSRGRDGYEFREGGKLVYYGIAATDGTDLLSGSWTIEGPNLVRIQIDNPRYKPYVLQVVSCDNQALKVKKQNL